MPKKTCRKMFNSVVVIENNLNAFNRLEGKVNKWYIFFKIYFYLFIYLFMTVLGLHCCVRALSSCGDGGPLFVTVHGLLIAVAYPVVEHGL